MWMRALVILGCTFTFMTVCCHAEKVVWSGKVNSNGNPTAPINLELHKEYQIKVSGVVKLGKWKRGGKPLANDACYEYIEEGNGNGNKDITKITTFRNSNDISVCDGKFHPEHLYVSPVFTANENKIHFWVYDTNYEDNYGAFDVEIVEVAK